MILIVYLYSYFAILTFTCFEVSCDFIYEDSIFCDNHYFIGKSGFCWWFLFLDFPTKKQNYLKHIFWGSEIFLVMDNFQFWEGKVENPFGRSEDLSCVGYIRQGVGVRS